MSKKLFLALAVLTPLATVQPAMALRTSATYRVEVEGNRVGSWRLRNRVVETSRACRYTVQWSNLGSALGRTTLCTIDELRASDDFDCEANRRKYFDTLIQRGGSCTGFDEFGQQTRISTLIAGEDSGGSINGVFSASSVGDIQSLEVNP
jgi:hypothetical protein